MSARAKRSPLVYALARLAPRERWLLGLLGAVFVPVAVVFLGLMPLLDARNAAQNAASEAEALLDWVVDQVRGLPADGAATISQSETQAPIGISAIEQSLVQAGLRDQVTDLTNRDEGGVDLALEGVEFEVLTGWLAGVSPDWGYQIAEFRIERGAESGLVRATFELAGTP